MALLDPQDQPEARRDDAQGDADHDRALPGLVRDVHDPVGQVGQPVPFGEEARQLIADRHPPQHDQESRKQQERRLAVARPERAVRCAGHVEGQHREHGRGEGVVDVVVDPVEPRPRILEMIPSAEEEPDDARDQETSNDDPCVRPAPLLAIDLVAGDLHQIQRPEPDRERHDDLDPVGEKILKSRERTVRDEELNDVDDAHESCDEEWNAALHAVTPP